MTCDKSYDLILSILVHSTYIILLYDVYAAHTVDGTL